MSTSLSTSAQCGCLQVMPAWIVSQRPDICRGHRNRRTGAPPLAIYKERAGAFERRPCRLELGVSLLPFGRPRMGSPIAVILPFFVVKQSAVSALATRVV